MTSNNLNLNFDNLNLNDNFLNQQSQQLQQNLEMSQRPIIFTPQDCNFEYYWGWLLENKKVAESR